MKLSPLPALLAVILTVSSVAHGQIVFGPAQAITGSDNLISDGTYLDAIQTRPGKTVATLIGTNTFNVGAYNSDNSTFGDGTIVFGAVASYLGGSGDSFDGTFTTGNATDNTTFGSVLQGTIYDDHAIDTITLNNLTVGNGYEVQVFKANANPDNSRNTAISGVATVAGLSVGTMTQLDAADFTVGTFIATAGSQSFTFGPGTGGGAYGEANALVLRDLGAVPEPSTYAIMLCLAGAVFCLRRKLAYLS